ASVTLDEALALIATKEAAGGGKAKGRSAARKPAAAKSGKKAAGKKKPVAKKAGDKVARRISGRKSSGGRRAAPVQSGGGGDLPSPEQIVRYVSDNPDRASKRDIAKAFGIKGGDRIWLKDALRDLEDQGLIQGGRRSFAR